MYKVRLERMPKPEVLKVRQGYCRTYQTSLHKGNLHRQLGLQWHDKQSGVLSFCTVPQSLLRTFLELKFMSFFYNQPKKDKDLNPQVGTLIVNSGMYLGSLRMNLGNDHRQYIFNKITGWKLNPIVMKRTKEQWDRQQSLVREKIKKKNAHKARKNANLTKNKTTSKRRLQAEQVGYIDSKTQCQNLLKSEVERKKMHKSSK